MTQTAPINWATLIQALAMMLFPTSQGYLLIEHGGLMEDFGWCWLVIGNAMLLAVVVAALWRKT